MADHKDQNGSGKQDRNQDDRRQKDRRKDEQPYTGPERRKHERRSGDDRRT